MLHRYCYSMSTSVTLNTVDSRKVYLTAALTYAAAYKGSLTKYKAMVAEFPEVNLKKCMSLSTIRKRVAKSITDGTRYGKGGSRAGAGRKRKSVLVEGETRKNTISRLHMRALRKERKDAENDWRGHTFPPILSEIGRQNYHRGGDYNFSICRKGVLLICPRYVSNLQEWEGSVFHK
jgi:hypothetical protein